MKKVLFILFILISGNAVAQVAPNCFSNITFAGSTTTSVTTMKKILADPAFSKGDHGCYVASFTITALPAKGDPTGPFNIQGTRLDPKTIAQLQHVNGKGPPTFLDNIKGIDNTGASRALPSFTLNLTE